MLLACSGVMLVLSSNPDAADATDKLMNTAIVNATILATNIKTDFIVTSHFDFDV